MKHTRKPHMQQPNVINLVNAMLKPPESQFSVDNWLAKQEHDLEELKRLFNFAAKSYKARHNAFINAGFSDEQAFELLKFDLSKVVK